MSNPEKRNDLRAALANMKTLALYPENEAFADELLEAVDDSERLEDVMDRVEDVVRMLCDAATGVGPGQLARVTPKTLRECATRLEALATAQGECEGCVDPVEAARIGYMAGHDDTVESRYGDPQETAEDICRDLRDELPDGAPQPEPGEMCNCPWETTPLLCGLCHLPARLTGPADCETCHLPAQWDALHKACAALHHWAQHNWEEYERERRKNDNLTTALAAAHDPLHDALWAYSEALDRVEKKRLSWQRREHEARQSAGECTLCPHLGAGDPLVDPQATELIRAHGQIENLKETLEYKRMDRSFSVDVELAQKKWIANLITELTQANAHIAKLEAGQCECPSCGTSLEYEPAAREMSLISERDGLRYRVGELETRNRVLMKRLEAS